MTEKTDELLVEKYESLTDKLEVLEFTISEINKYVNDISEALFNTAPTYVHAKEDNDNKGFIGDIIHKIDFLISVSKNIRNISEEALDKILREANKGK